MDHAYEMEFHNRRMNAEQDREEVYREQLRPFYLLRPTVSLDGNQWCCLYGGDPQSGVSAFGDTPDQASKNFDVAWLNQKGLNPPPKQTRPHVSLTPMPPAQVIPATVTLELFGDGLFRVVQTHDNFNPAATHRFTLDVPPPGCVPESGVGK